MPGSNARSEDCHKFIPVPRKRRHTVAATGHDPAFYRATPIRFNLCPQIVNAGVAGCRDTSRHCGKFRLCALGRAHCLQQQFGAVGGKHSGIREHAPP